MRRSVALTVVLLLSAGGGWASAQGPFTAQIQAALRALGLTGVTYTNGQVPVFNSTTGRFAPGSAGSAAFPLAAGAADNCAAVPYSFTSDTNTGLCQPAANQLAFMVDGTKTIVSTTTVVTLSEQSSAFQLVVNADTSTLTLGFTNAISLSNGAANRLDLATGDSLNLVLGNLMLAGEIIISGTAPTIASGFCTTPSVGATANGTAAFPITIGSACAASIGTLTMPAATTGWVCDFNNRSAPESNVVVQTGGSTTTVDVQNFARTTGLASNFTNGQLLTGKCTAY